MEELEVKDILLSLVEPNRKNPRGSEHIPETVVGWRFPSTASNSNDGITELSADDKNYQTPVCEWTRVLCDPIDNSITGLDLKDGFWINSLLGHDVQNEYKDDDDAMTGSRTRKLETTAATNSNENDPSPPIQISLPQSLGKLTTLRLLTFSSNQIHGPIPQSILALPNLELFAAPSNDLLGTFPHFESDSLRVLDISHNRFHGPLPRELFAHPVVGQSTAPYLESLVKFDVSHNGFNGTIPLDGVSATYEEKDGVGFDPSLQNVQYFDVGYNMFSGTICNNFGNLASLQGLFLEHNRLVGTIPKALFRGSGLGANPLPLVQLFLQQNDLSGTLPSGLGTLPNLREIYVDGNKLTGIVPDSLCEKRLNNPYLDEVNDNADAPATGCDLISCPSNSISPEGMAPCTSCPPDGGYHRYIGQRDDACQKILSEVEILDLLYEVTHGDGWRRNRDSYVWEKGSPACERKGISCDESGRVVNITLPSLGLRGPLPGELGNLNELAYLDVSHNQLTGFLPSDLRFLPMAHLDIRGNKMQGVIPPMLCIKDGINNNGRAPSGTDLSLLYSCDNIACPRGTWSPIGRASLYGMGGEIDTNKSGNQTENERISCMPCFDDRATYYIGRDQCSDITIGGMQIRKEDIQQGIQRFTPAMLAILFLIITLTSLRRRRKRLTQDVMRTPNEVNSNNILRRLSSSMGGLFGNGDIEELSDDDWTAADSEVPRSKQQAASEMVELGSLRRSSWGKGTQRPRNDDDDDDWDDGIGSPRVPADML